MPQQRQVGMPPQRFGLASGGLTVAVVGRMIASERITETTTRVRRHVETNRDHQTAQLRAGRERTTESVLHAARERLTMLSALA